MHDNPKEAAAMTDTRAATRYTGTLAIELTCRICRQPHIPTPEDFRAGPATYHRCPSCRSVSARDSSV